MGLTDSIKKNLPYATTAVAAGITLYTAYDSFNRLLAYQWALLAAVFILSAGIYIGLGRTALDRPLLRHAAVLALYGVVALFAYYPTITNLFRSDDWLLLALFDSVSGYSLDTIKRISFFEMFGHIRFQPLAHLMIYARYHLFGNNMVLYHIANISLHVMTAFLIYLTVMVFTKRAQFSFIFGLLFLTLPSQFDTVSWTYHIYIIVGASFVLLSVLLAEVYAEKGSIAAVSGAVLLAVVSLILYEPAALAPLAVVFAIAAIDISRDRALSKKKLMTAAAFMFAAYVIYAMLAAYGVSVTKAKHAMSLTDLLKPRYLIASVSTLFLNLWESTFLKNIGIEPLFKVTDIVYINLPEDLYTNPVSIIRMIGGLFLLSLLRPSKRLWQITLVLVAIAISYMYIITLGRTISNDASYILSQPRYHYFPNAVLVAVAGLLLWPKFSEGGLKKAMVVTLFAVFLWNTEATVAANNMVTEGMQALDVPFYNIKDFFKKNPSAKLVLDFTPDAKGQFFLGSDTAMDILYKGRITKYVSRATHIYDGFEFRENPLYNPGASKGDLLQDFTVLWTYVHGSYYRLKKDVVVVGDSSTFPRITILPGDVLRVEMINAINENIDSYFFPFKRSHDHDIENYWMVNAMVLVKEGDSLCFGFDGVVQDKARIKTPYRGWDKDGFGLFGDYYRGAGVSIYITNLYMLGDMAGYECKKSAIGDGVSRKN